MVERNDTVGQVVERSGSQLTLVKAWLERALRADPHSVPIRLNLADLHTSKQQYDAAAPIYREVLRDAPDNTIALNNLA